MSTERPDVPDRGLEDVVIPVGGGFWRALGGNGALAVGYALLTVHVAVLGVVALLLAGDSLPDHASEERLVRLVELSTVLLPLFAMCFLSIGELVRRGRWGGPSGHKPDGWLPQGTTTVQLRLIPVRWNVAWVLVTAGLAALGLWLAVKDTLDLLFGGRLEIMLIVNGILFAGAFGAAAGALLKKVAWFRHLRVRLAGAPPHPAVARRKDGSMGRTFWRSFSFRWRFDIWLCGLGVLSTWLAAYSALTMEQIPGSGSAAWIFGSVGAAFTCAGLWATTQFWRAGEDLASGESVA